MNFKRSIIATTLLTFFFTAEGGTLNELEGAKETAEKFVKFIDKSEADKLRAIVHPDMLQYTNLGGKLIPFKGADFIQMVADKKLGGKPRKVSHKSADIIRGNAAYVTLNAVSEEYDFLYQLSMAKQASGNWIIVGISAEINKV